jgi:hypothetical protein
MNNNVGDVVAAWVYAVKLNISHVRYPGNRMPVGYMIRSKCPKNIFVSYAACNMRVAYNVYIIVVTKELVTYNLRVYC